MLALIAAGDGDTCICRIQDQFELSQPTLSHHASVLRQAGLITSRQDGVWVHHSAVPSALESLVDLLSTLVPPTAQTVAR
jgi:ArsR family transcriptional regulator